MTVAELRALLAEHPDDMLVVVPGYEGGLDDVQAGTVHITLDDADDVARAYSGPHSGRDTPAPGSTLCLALWPASEDEGFLTR